MKNMQRGWNRIGIVAGAAIGLVIAVVILSSLFEGESILPAVAVGIVTFVFVFGICAGIGWIHQRIPWKRLKDELQLRRPRQGEAAWTLMVPSPPASTRVRPSAPRRSARGSCCARCYPCFS